MSRALRLYNSFSRSINEVQLGGKLVSVNSLNGHTLNGSFYICGPTVYSQSHLGHAITYTRADLFRRFMKSIFNVNLTTVMNITDIDDKILSKALEDGANSLASRDVDGSEGGQVTFSPDPSSHPFNLVGDRYYRSFLDDMELIRVRPPDISIKVSQQVDLIAKYIRRLENTGHAYVATNGDIYFSVSSIANYVGRLDGRSDVGLRSSEESVKRDPRDFALWKASRPNEPVWYYRSDVTNQTIAGRPGWHIQCSAICSAIFGDKLDFHFGGKDLIFPHHYNEQACCSAYHNLDTSENFHVWSNNWLHSGHLVLRDEKMSKSIGNVMSIKDFIKSSSVNALRLLCIESHYRADINLSEDLIQEIESLNHKLSAFCSYLGDEIRRLSASSLLVSCNDGIDLSQSICEVQEAILDGICDDLDLNRGLMSILELSKRVYNVGSGCLRPNDLISIWHILVDWCTLCDLDYVPLRGTHQQNLVELVGDFRNTVRLLALEELRGRKKEDNSSGQREVFLKTLLDSCDRVRSRLDKFGYVIRDNKT